MTVEEADALVVANLGRIRRWAEWMEGRFPGVDWEQAALDAIHSALRRHRGGDFGGTLAWAFRHVRSLELRRQRRRPAEQFAHHWSDNLILDPRDHEAEAIRRAEARDEVEHLMANVLTPAERRAAAHILAGGTRFGNHTINRALCRARARLAATL